MLLFATCLIFIYIRLFCLYTGAKRELLAQNWGATREGWATTGRTVQYRNAYTLNQPKKHEKNLYCRLWPCAVWHYIAASIGCWTLLSYVSFAVRSPESERSSCRKESSPPAHRARPLEQTHTISVCFRSSLLNWLTHQSRSTDSTSFQALLSRLIWCSIVWFASFGRYWMLLRVTGARRTLLKSIDWKSLLEEKIEQPR